MSRVVSCTHDEAARLLTTELVPPREHALVVAAIGAEPDRLRAGLEAAGIEVGSAPGAVVVYGVAAGRQGRRVLSLLNRDRDLLVAAHRALVLCAETADDLARLRSTAPDLAAFLDLVVRVEPGVVRGWKEVRSALQELMLGRHHQIDLTGLVPAKAERTHLPLRHVYMDLVPLGSPVSQTTRADGATVAPLASEGGKPLLLLGHPGCGKTTFLRWLVCCYADPGPRPRDPLGLGRVTPVLIPLADYAEDRDRRIRPLDEFLPCWLAEAGIEGAEALRRHLGELLVLFDGVDEVRDSEVRRDVLAEVHRFVARARPTGCVVTGRSLLVDEMGVGDLRRFDVRYCLPPGDEQIQEYLKAFLRHRTGPDAATRVTSECDSEAAALWGTIGSDVELRSLARTPLLLVFLLLLYTLEGRLPDRRTLLYYRLAQLLIDRWSRARSLARLRVEGTRRRETTGDAQRVLGPLAWWVLERSSGTVGHEELERELVRIQRRRGDEAPAAQRRARALLRLLEEDTALLVPHGRRRWSFVHPTVAEYFAGVELARSRARWKGLVERDPYEPDLREVVVFSVGQLTHVQADDERLDAAVSELLARSIRRGRYDARYPSLLAGVLREEPALSARLEQELVERLMRFWFWHAFGEYAARQVQEEAVSTLWDCVSRSCRGSLSAALSDWFLPTPQRVRWDRLVAGGGWLPLWMLMPTLFGGRWKWGDDPARTGRPLLDNLVPLLKRYGVDHRPTLRTLLDSGVDEVRRLTWTSIEQGDIEVGELRDRANMETGAVAEAAEAVLAGLSETMDAHSRAY